MPKQAAPKPKRAANHGSHEGPGPQAKQKRTRTRGASDAPAVGVLQPKMRVSEPNDKFEREADHVADRVMRAPAGAAVTSERADEEQKPTVQREKTEKDEELKAQTFSLQREEAKEEEQEVQTFSLQREKTEKEEEEVQTSALQRAEEEEEAPPVQRQEGVVEAEPEKEEEEASPPSLQRKEGEEEEQMQQRAKRPRRPEITPDFEARLKLLRRGGGQPLPDTLRAFLEPRFGRSLSDVRVHFGGEAAELAQKANARAFTVGKHIVFGAGEYRPGVEQGQRLIAHELTHVFQQRGGLHSVQREVGPDRAPAEPPQAALPTIEELRAAFRLDSEAAPPSVRTIALALLRTALLKRSDAERLTPLTDAGGDAGSLLRKIVSGSYTLELAAMRGGGGVERGWRLTDRERRLTFVSNANGRQFPAGSNTAGGTITLPSPPAPEQYAKGTYAAGLASSRENDPTAPTPTTKPTPLVPASVPAGSVPAEAPPFRTPEPAAEKVPPARSTKPSKPAEPAEPLDLSKPAKAKGKGAAAPEGGAPSEAEGGEPAAEIERAPQDPSEDPEFQQTLGQIRRTRKAQAKHELPEKKLGEVKDSAVLPTETQSESNDRDAHLKEIDSVAEKSQQVAFTPDTFKKLLAKSLEGLEQQLPQNEDQAEDFKEQKPLEATKENIRGQVEDQKQKMSGPLATEVTAPQPPASGLPVETPADLKEELPGKKPHNINRVDAAPKPRTDAEISLEAESRSLDEKMAENNITEEQLAQSNEPTFIQALDSKKEAQQKAAEAPGVYREQEAQILEGAQGKAGARGAAKFGAMFETREGAFGDVFSKQDTTTKSDKDEQLKVVGGLKTIYEGTKTDVDTILDDLTSCVNDIFTEKVDKAKTDFEKRVESQLDDIYGITVIDDWIFGEDTEAIEGVFRKEKAKFLATMDAVIDEIAQLIADKLNAAIKRIDEGRTAAENYFKGLDTEQQRLAQEAMDSFRQQFDTLEETVRDKQQELADSLAESYKSSVDSLRESFDKIKDEVSKGWIGAALEFIGDVATAIYRLGQLLLSLLTRIANVIGDILAHPIRFLENLAEGVGNGFKMFGEKIDEYLLAAFFDWVRGSVGGAGITLPEKFDAAGIFDLVAQVLGLSWETFREIAQRVWGKASVEFLEKGAAVAEKGLEIFYLVREKGLGGLWDYIVDTVSSHVDEVVEKAKETVFYETIKRALIWIAGLFNPVGAFIKAAQAIYAGLKFLVDNIERIEKLVDAFMTSIEMAVAGNTAAISQRIVEGLRLAVVMAIDFLAKLLGLGNLAEKVRKILKAIRKPVERAIESVLKKLRPFVHGVLRKLGVKGVGPKEKKKEEKKKKEKAEQKALGEEGKPLTHEGVIDAVVREMSRQTKAETPAAALAEKQAHAESLIKKYQPMLKKGRLKILITDQGGEDVLEDAAVDFDVSASPGTPGQAGVPITVDDDKIVQQRFAHARTLKKFTGEKGFTLDDWGVTFGHLSVGTHKTDLRYGKKKKIIRQDGDTYHFRETAKTEDDFVERGAAVLQDEGRQHVPFQNGRFGVPLIQAFLTGLKIPGVTPGTFDDTALVSRVADRAEKAGAITKLGNSNAWAFPTIGTKRTLPDDWGGDSHVRPRYYERGSSYTTLATAFATKEIARLVEPRIKKLIKKPTNLTPWNEMLNLGLADDVENEQFDWDAAVAGEYYVRERYDVDHITSLAEHWQEVGHDDDWNERIAAAEGKKDPSKFRKGFQLLEAGVNRRKGSGGIKYQLWVGPNFKLPNLDFYYADTGVLFKEYE
jgi:hypothetical protein